MIATVIADYVTDEDRGKGSGMQGIGNGLMLGLCVAFIGLAVDHIITRWARERSAQLGLS